MRITVEHRLIWAKFRWNKRPFARLWQEILIFTCRHRKWNKHEEDEGDSTDYWWFACTRCRGQLL